MNEAIEILIYEDASGKSPYKSWFNKLDTTTQLIIDNRLSRVRLGNFGDCEPVKEGVFELKFKYGPGYRIYFGKINNTIILLINGGNKGNQSRDIEKAKQYWIQYKEKII